MTRVGPDELRVALTELVKEVDEAVDNLGSEDFLWCRVAGGNDCPLCYEYPHGTPCAWHHARSLLGLSGSNHGVETIEERAARRLRRRENEAAMKAHPGRRPWWPEVVAMTNEYKRQVAAKKAQEPLTLEINTEEKS